ncbi:CRISPR-associated endonuclease Cas1 [Rhodovulum sp. 12E13]|nr:CRISPR-associated endonuclease Cas1 [Rhodovulum sp. 12E13]
MAAGAASGAGLDPAVGMYHAERPGRPALALDIVEPFRVGVVDAAVLAGLNEGRFAADDFAMEGEGGVRLTDQGRRRALGLLEQRLSTRFRDGETETSWRDAITRSAARLASGLRGGRARLAVPLPTG